MKPAAPYQRVLAVHIAGANPSRELVHEPRHRWWRIALVGAIPTIGLVTAIVELIRFGVH